MGELYHKNLVIADASAILYCWTIVNVVQPSFGWTRSLFVPDRTHSFVPAPSSNQLRVYGAFSRRIKEGMLRVETRTESKDVYASAFVGEKDRRTVVILNRSTISQKIRLTGLSGGFEYMEVVDPYNENKTLNAQEAFDDRSPEVLVAPGAIVTLSTVPLGTLPEGFVIGE